MSPRAVHVSLALGSALVALAVAVAVHRATRTEPPVVEGVGGSPARYDELLRSRQAEPPPSPRDDRLVREAVPPDVARVLFPVLDRERFAFDEHAFFRPAGGLALRARFHEHPDGGWDLATNSLGLKEDHEPPVPPPEWCVLVTGDSHTLGACGTDEAFANLLEARLRASEPGRTCEVWNAGCTNYSFYQYLGTLERLAELRPDVFVVVVYGGNDFRELMRLQRYFHRRPPPVFEGRPTLADDFEDWSAPWFQDLSQASYFALNPEDAEEARATIRAATLEIRDRCAEIGAVPLFVHLPAASVGQPRLYAPVYQRLLAGLELEAEDVLVGARLADAWLELLADEGLAHVDLREAFRAADENLYWETDFHINLRGHELVAQVLEGEVLRLLRRR